MDWRDRFELELTNAEKARGRGNEGQARVCARRAAGIAATEFVERSGQTPGTGSALDTLRELLNDPQIPATAFATLNNLLMQVDSNFKLPAGVDLIGEARALRDQLLPEG